MKKQFFKYNWWKPNFNNNAPTKHLIIMKNWKNFFYSKILKKQIALSGTGKILLAVLEAYENFDTTTFSILIIY